MRTIRSGRPGFTQCWMILVFTHLGQLASATPPQAAPPPVQTPQDTSAERATTVLVEAGFENVATKLIGEHLVVTFENRKFRYDVAAASIASDLLSDSLGIEGPVTIIPQRRGLALRGIQFGADTSRTAESAIEVDDALRPLDGLPRKNSSSLRFDLILRPDLTTIIGGRGDAIESRFNLSLELRSTFWTGFDGLGQLIIPVFTQFDERNPLRPGILAVNQTLRLPFNTFSSLSAGIFGQNRYGFDFETRTYFLDGIVAAGFRVGRTGLAVFDYGEWYYSSLRWWSGAFTLDVAIPKYALRVRSSLEQFMFEDRGIRVDIVRGFGEIEIGIFGVLTENAENLGATISIPIFPGRYSRPNWLRARPATHFDWEYQYDPYPREGRRYTTGFELDQLWNGVYPALFDSHAARLQAKGY